MPRYDTTHKSTPRWLGCWNAKSATDPPFALGVDHLSQWWFCWTFRFPQRKPVNSFRWNHTGNIDFWWILLLLLNGFRAIVLNPITPYLVSRMAASEKTMRDTNYISFSFSFSTTKSSIAVNRHCRISRDTFIIINNENKLQSSSSFQW